MSKKKPEVMYAAEARRMPAKAKMAASLKGLSKKMEKESSYRTGGGGRGGGGDGGGGGGGGGGMMKKSLKKSGITKKIEVAEGTL